MNKSDIITPSMYMEAGFAYDRAGKEREAIPLYKKALEGNLSDNDRMNVCFCLASSYRTIGNTTTAKKVINKAIKNYPEEPILKIMASLIDLDNGYHNLSVSRLITVCSENIKTENIGKYASFLKREASKTIQKNSTLTQENRTKPF